MQKIYQLLENFGKHRIKKLEAQKQYFDLLSTQGLDSWTTFTKTNLLNVKDEINEFIEKYRNKARKKRYVAFNQGIDCRYVNEGNMKLLGKLPIRPMRIAFDHMVALLLVTGHETTVHQIGNSVLTLLQQPAQFARFKNDSAIIDLAFEELLRYDGPVETSTTRWARQDIEFGRQLIQHGDIVRVVLTSANRDATHFIQPDQLNLTRQNNRHLAFGHGIHYCLGAPLARLEGKIALETLFQHLPQLRLAVPISDLAWQSGVIFRGLTSLPVKWD